MNVCNKANDNADNKELSRGPFFVKDCFFSYEITERY